MTSVHEVRYTLKQKDKIIDNLQKISLDQELFIGKNINLMKYIDDVKKELMNKQIIENQLRFEQGNVIISY